MSEVMDFYGVSIEPFRGDLEALEKWLITPGLMNTEFHPSPISIDQNLSDT